MQLWDRLSLNSTNVLVFGATNRPQDLDEAIKRRFERSFLLDLPNQKSRIHIFKLILKSINIDKTCKSYR